MIKKTIKWLQWQKIRDSRSSKINEKILKIFLLPKDQDDEKNVIVEIRAGTGGLEATLFVSIYLKCMKKFVLKKWKMEIISISKSEAGRFKEIIFSVKGNFLFSKSGFTEFRECQVEAQGECILLRQQLQYYQKQKMLI